MIHLRISSHPHHLAALFHPSNGPIEIDGTPGFRSSGFIEDQGLLLRGIPDFDGPNDGGVGVFAVGEDEVSAPDTDVILTFDLAGSAHSYQGFYGNFFAVLHEGESESGGGGVRVKKTKK